MTCARGSVIPTVAKRSDGLARVSIEVAYDGGTTFEIIDAVTTVKYDHYDQIPGRPVTYRVFAKRRGEKSAPSNTAVIYQSGGGQQDAGLKVA